MSEIELHDWLYDTSLRAELQQLGAWQMGVAIFERRAYDVEPGARFARWRE